ncbi:MAG: hypothetical protein ABI167_04735 [Nitrosospira sp.]
MEQDIFRNMLDHKNRLTIAVAKKGIGKSALIQWLSYQISQTQSEALIVKCRGSDITRAQFNLKSKLESPNDHIRDWMIRLCAIANRRIASEIGFALTDDAMTIVETAELEGFKQKNLIGALTTRFTRLLGKLAPQSSKAGNEVELLKRAENRNLWILIDDLDATFQNTPEECLTISTFFSACRYLTQDVKGVAIRVTMRANVWSVIRRYDESLDKLEQYVHEIKWEESDFRRLLYRRIKSQLDDLGAPYPAINGRSSEEEREQQFIQLIFVPRAEWAGINVQIYRLIYTLSYHRPRWAIQLCKLMQKEARATRDTLLTKGHVDAVWGEYGLKRIADLVAEHKHQCKQIEELINAFRGAKHLMSRDQLVVWVKHHITNHLTPFINGVAANSPLDVAHMLYEIGFIVARSEDIESYEHYSFELMPDFLSSRTNDDFGMSWEIHPCYREALDIVKLNNAKRERMRRARKNAKGQ